MAIANVAQLKQLLKNATRTTIYKSAASHQQAGSPGFFRSLWVVQPDAPSAPSTTNALTSSTAGAIPFVNGDTGTMWFTSVQFSYDPVQGANNGGVFVLYDRLVHHNGLSGTDISTQTTNLPTAALTRYTDGVGVMAALEVYTAVGSSSVSATCSYTNQGGTSGQTGSVTSRVGGLAANRAAESFLTMTLQPGDSGVRSVESVTLSGSTGTVGSFGVTLFKPLAIIPVFATNDDHFYTILDGLFPVEMTDNAHLALLCLRGGNNSAINSLSFYGQLGFGEA